MKNFIAYVGGGLVCVFLLAVVVAVAGGSAVNRSEDGGGAVDAQNIYLTPAADVTSTGDRPTLLLVSNRTTEVLCSVYLSSEAAEGSEIDLLDQDILIPQSTITVPVEPGTYQLDAWNCMGVSLAEVPALTIESGEDAQWVIASGPLPEVEVTPTFGLDD